MVEEIAEIKLGFETKKFLNKSAEVINKEFKEFMSDPARTFGG